MLTPTQQQHFAERGYFIASGVLDRDSAMEVRGVIKDHILRPEQGTDGDTADPMDPMMGDDAAARAARFRKLSGLGTASPVLWMHVYTNPPILRLARALLGDDLLVKYASCFLKPARTGSATPWHQDNGLWRDGETRPFNFWIAIDPATRANGCLQFIPGTHREPIESHVTYDDSIHPELPRERVEAMASRHGVEHIELEPGDAVCWHSNLYHYSPPNRSAASRIAVAGVITSPHILAETGLPRNLPWCLRRGEACAPFPPESFVYEGKADAV